MPRELRYHYRSNRSTSPKKTSLLYYIVPFLIVNIIIFFALTLRPKFEIEISNSTDFKTVDITITKKSLYPLSSLEIYYDGETLEMTQTGNIYTTTVEKNGTIELIATNLNTMTLTLFEVVDGIDDSAPTIYGEVTQAGLVTVSFEDTLSGLNFSSLYGLDEEGHHLKPTTLNESEAEATFTYEGETLDVYISDNAGHEALSSFSNSDLTADENTDEATTQESTGE